MEHKETPFSRLVSLCEKVCEGDTKKAILLSKTHKSDVFRKAYEEIVKKLITLENKEASNKPIVQPKVKPKVQQRVIFVEQGELSQKEAKLLEEKEKKLDALLSRLEGTKVRTTFGAKRAKQNISQSSVTPKPKANWFGRAFKARMYSDIKPIKYKTDCQKTSEKYSKSDLTLANAKNFQDYSDCCRNEEKYGWISVRSGKTKVWVGPKKKR